MDRRLLSLSILLFVALGCNFDSASTTTNIETQVASANQSSSPSTNAAPPGEAVAEVTPTPLPPNAVCPEPAKPCHHKDRHFEDWELSFKMPAKLQPNKQNKSAQFYAVLLKTFDAEDDCDGGEYVESIEVERKQIQNEHKTRKVFASYECPNMGALSYDFPGRHDAKKEQILIGNFIAIYAGYTKQEAEELLKSVKAKYPQAAVKPMTVSYDMIVQ